MAEPADSILRAIWQLNGDLVAAADLMRRRRKPRAGFCLCLFKTLREFRLTVGEREQALARRFSKKVRATRSGTMPRCAAPAVGGASAPSNVEMPPADVRAHFRPICPSSKPHWVDISPIAGALSLLLQGPCCRVRAAGPQAATL